MILKKGYNHLYYGDGKGKTSIVNGMVVRALGCEFESNQKFKVKYYRFMKNWPTGEINTFKKLGLVIEDCYFSGNKFFWEMDDAEKAVVKKEVAVGVAKLYDDVVNGDYDIIFIDELFSCYDDHLISKEVLIDLLTKKNPCTELVFSAHKVADDFFAYFDLISKVVKKKHYYETEKVLARKGIEM